MRKFRRWLPIIIALLFQLVTIRHEAAYVGSYETPGWEWLGIPFSIGVDTATFISLFYTKWATTRKWAWISFVLFVAASAALNLAHIFDVAIAGDRFGQGLLPDLVTGMGVATVALFPTAAIVVMGFLERETDGFRTRKKTAPQSTVSPSPSVIAAPPPAKKRTFEEFQQAVAGSLLAADVPTAELAAWAAISSRQARRWKAKATAGQ